jgi:hypothetical protein
MRYLKWQLIGGFLTVLLAVPAWGAPPDRATPAQPGTVNYVEGDVTAGTNALSASSIGATQLAAGETLSTKSGKAEVLLTPGVFFRVGDHSSMTMTSPSLSDTQVALNDGRAMVEVAEIHPANDISVSEDGASTRLMKTGLYGFDAERRQVRVFEGEAVVTEDGRSTKVKGGHEVDLSAEGRLAARRFDKAEFTSDDLYRWSSLRSSYLAEANVDEAPVYAGYPYWGPWFADGWYWDPWFGAYTFIPGDGIFYSPFGWGFYSPWLVGYAPVYYRGEFVHTFGAGYRPALGRGVTAPTALHSYHVSGAFAGRGGVGHASAGGFHGSMGGGGFHGGGGFGGGGHGGR